VAIVVSVRKRRGSFIVFLRVVSEFGEMELPFKWMGSLRVIFCWVGAVV